MADIFISYSTFEPEWTQELAVDLEAQGYTTWWDTRLLTSDGFFPQKIKDELTAANAVIVIWSEASVKSEWVYDEAQMAKRLGKLIMVRTPSLDIAMVPMPFGARHVETITNRTKLFAALEVFGVIPQSGRTLATDDAEALYMRGRDYYYGHGVQQNYSEAARLYRKAADMGHAQTLTLLGLMHAEGVGVEQNYFEALRLFRESAILGNAKALGCLGRMYMDGHGITQDYEEAIRLLSKAADMGDIDANTDLAYLHFVGLGTPCNLSEAARLYQRGANMGSSDCAYSLALFYELGWGIEQSIEKALSEFCVGFS